VTSYRLKEKRRSGLLQNTTAVEAKLIEAAKRGVPTWRTISKNAPGSSSCFDAPLAHSALNQIARKPLTVSPPDQETRRAGVG
jgi:hypothetical protein